jgi:S1-C subfamily serine protease
MAAVRLFKNARVCKINSNVQKGFLNIGYCTPTARNVKTFLTSTNQSGNYDKLWRKIQFCLGICIGCATGFQLLDWLDNKGIQIRYHDSTAHAKTGTSKSKQFNFVADVVEIIAPAVVHIEGQRQQHGFMGHVVSSGSGFLVSEDGLVLTNAHVVQNMRNVTVTLSDGSSIMGDIVSLDRASDLASVQLRNPSKVSFH